MKRKILIGLTFVLSICFLSCNQKTRTEEFYPTEYYPTGEVYKTEKKINERETEVRFYYRNGQIEQEGIRRDSLAEGQWNDYYNDGVLRGELILSKGKVINENIIYPITLDFKDNPTEFKVGQSYPFRILGVSWFYSMKMPNTLSYRQILIDDFNDAQYLDEITPQTAGDYTIRVTVEEIKHDTIFFPIKVVD